jgi:hypothetical protein
VVEALEQRDRVAGRLRVRVAQVADAVVVAVAWGQGRERRAVVARVAPGVAVLVTLIRVGDGRAVVDRVGDAVAVLIGAAAVGRGGGIDGRVGERRPGGAALEPVVGDADLAVRTARRRRPGRTARPPVRSGGSRQRAR